MITRRKLTSYEAIPIFIRNLNVRNVSDFYTLGLLVDALRSWGLHGSANNLEHWISRMHDHMDYEMSAEPLGIIDWEQE